MSISRKLPRSVERATILQFPTPDASSVRQRTSRDDGEWFVIETYWMIVATAADGTTCRTKVRAPRFLSPCRAYAWFRGTASGVRSLLLYKFARRPAAQEPPTRYRRIA